jgi:hypothetical protein
MSNNPIVVTTKPIQLSSTVRGPIVVTQQEGDSGDTTISKFGYNQPTYKVKLVANGKTFNMLLPPSIESKHPGRSNPLQLPGLQIKAGVNISKLKIPGFFPIYQNLGVESLTVSMSGMFTGYDGTNVVAAANWENAVGIGQSEVQQGQDSFASASELYDFAVKNKALVQVTIYTSDGSFIPKKSASTTFRDTSSNISFKGYIKEFEQVYIRQDRNYYMLKFEIIDFGSNKCKTVVKSDKTKDKVNDKAKDLSIKERLLLLDNKITPENINKLNSLKDKGKISNSNLNKILDEIALGKLSNSNIAQITKLVEGNKLSDNNLTNILKNITFNKLPNTTLTTILENIALNKLSSNNTDKLLQDIALGRLPTTRTNDTDINNNSPIEKQIQDILNENKNSGLYNNLSKTGSKTTLGNIKPYLASIVVYDDSIPVEYLGNIPIYSSFSTKLYGTFRIANTIYYAVPIDPEEKQYELRILTDAPEDPKNIQNAIDNINNTNTNTNTNTNNLSALPSTSPASLTSQLKNISQQENSGLYREFNTTGSETTLGNVKSYLDLFVFDDNIKISYLGNTKISALSASQPLTQEYGLFKVENSVYYAVPIQGESPKKYTLRLLTDYDENFRSRIGN